MSITSKLAQCAVVVTTSLALAAPAHGAYGWPVKPFHAQHPVRGFLGDPRIDGTDWLHGTIHFGTDISAADGTPVYATLDGIAAPNSLHPDVVIVRGPGGVAHEYWHVVPAVRWGAPVVAHRTVIGYVEAPWKHAHFSEWRNGVYLNPLRPGALSPYRDTTRPNVHLISFERNGAGVGARVSGPWDTRAVANGVYRVVVVARDTAGNEGRAERSLTIANGA